jgi:hypothetical protein
MPTYTYPPRVRSLALLHCSLLRSTYPPRRSSLALLTDGACNGAARQEKHSYETAKAAAKAYDAYTRSLLGDEPKFRQVILRRSMNFCDLCGRFRNPKKCEEGLLGSLVLCECEEEEEDEEEE